MVGVEMSEIGLPGKIDAYAALRSERLDAQRALDKLKEEEIKLHDEIMGLLLEMGSSQMGGISHVAKINSSIVPTVVDWEALDEYTRENGIALFKTVSPAAARELWENGVEIPGVSKVEVFKLSVSKVS